MGFRKVAYGNLVCSSRSHGYTRGFLRYAVAPPRTSGFSFFGRGCRWPRFGPGGSMDHLSEVDGLEHASRAM